ncbi:hypothetical protein ID866_3638 [Astraeus odoratus]|nr:hypothetical protein ID866_3638 [Astraeus odoratus]
MPHRHRHVLGWHRILTELKDSDVERRREIHRMDSARCAVEAARLNRLQQLMHLLPHYRSLRATDRQRITEALGKVAASSLPSAQTDLRRSASTVSNRRTGCTAISAQGAPSVGAAPSSFHHFDPVFYEYGTVTEEDLDDALEAMNGQSFTVAHHSEATEHTWQDEVEQENNVFASVHHTPSSDDPDATEWPAVLWRNVGDAEDPARHWLSDVPSSAEPCLPPDDVQSALSTLYGEYRKGLDQLTSIPLSFDVPVMPDFIPDPTEAGFEYAMSKSQLQMTMVEGRIWQSLAASVLPPEIEGALMSLARKSSAISYSYHRRTNLPSPDTYEECKEILRAMGVPCIDATGPFEAEALASSLVLHGHADFVASEDTDVLVYEAPLVRNIASRDSPLILISGSEVRTALELDRRRFIDFILLLGTDFSQRIKNIGPQRALKFIKEYGSIESVVEHEVKYPPRVPVRTYLAQVEDARMVFNTLPPVPALQLLLPSPTNQTAISHLIQKYKLHRVLHDHWDYSSALTGNYFHDNPSVTYTS